MLRNVAAVDCLAGAMVRARAFIFLFVVAARIARPHTIPQRCCIVGSSINRTLCSAVDFWHYSCIGAAGVDAPRKPDSSDCRVPGGILRAALVFYIQKLFVFFDFFVVYPPKKNAHFFNSQKGLRFSHASYKQTMGDEIRNFTRSKILFCLARD